MNFSFEDVWKKVILNEGQVFETIIGKEFTYKIENNILLTCSTHYPLSKGNFEKAYNMLPLNGPGEISKIVRGSSYVWVILNDRRII